MGVKGLWKLISNCAEKHTPQNTTLAIDTSIWIHQYKGMPETEVIYYVSKKIIKLLYHEIRPVFIFDGAPNLLKRKVIEERKKENLDKLVKDIINNEICKKCKIKIRMCIHGGLIKDEFEEDTLKGLHEWGKNIKEEKQEIKKISTDSDFYNTENILKFLDSKKYSNSQKLKMLVKMRERRKQRFNIDKKSMTDFSKLQIKNVKNRNLKNKKKINSDCNKSFFLKTNKKTIPMRNENSSDGDINDFLEIDETISHRNIDDNYVIPIKKIKNDFSDEIVAICKTKNEKFSEGFFAEENNYEADNETNEINYDFSQGKTIKISKIDSNLNEPMDFLNVLSIIKEIINAFNLPYLDSPSESDAECGFLYRAGVIDGVITEDNDILLHGGVVYKNFFRKNKNILRYDPKRIEEVKGLSTFDIIDLGFVLGSDYTVGIKGIGIKNAEKYIKSENFKNIDIQSYRNIYLNCPIREDWRPKFKTLEFEKIVQFFVNKGIDKEKIDELKFGAFSLYPPLTNIN
ncbi:DNA repair protein RAD2 [Vairimorpha necatrix]|uniref:DNA repair protein RAD2 n=1 Tax=Vairimorpha necatrix TaxID=6039 RepID=A0AAX4JAH8_9MICR